MKPWVLLDSTDIPNNGGELRLYQREDEFSIKIMGVGELMNSRIHSSEDALAELALQKLNHVTEPKILIGGLGMGYTLLETLKLSSNNSQVDVAELIPSVVEWNKGPLGVLTNNCINDKRVTVIVDDVLNVIKQNRNTYDAILLDVDNGPEGLTHEDNDKLYSNRGLKESFNSLKSNGVLAVWSSGPSNDFVKKLKRTGFKVEEKKVRGHGKKGAHHIIWLATKP